MATHNVVLTYKQNGDFSADPFSIRVRKGETIGFSLGTGSLSGRIRIKFHDHRFFGAHTPHFADTGIYLGGDGDVTVAVKPNVRTTYHCELVDAAGTVIGQSHEQPGGGEVLPSTEA